ncbi:hypothetical protein P4056_23020 [Pseudomonas aeruginosa]|nr:hypothetical protein [Pseudomonas aeruginosa]
MSSLVVQIEKDGTTLQLVEAKARGGVGQVDRCRSTGPLQHRSPAADVPDPGDEIQGIRAVGSRTELQSAEAVVASAWKKRAASWT